MEVSAEKLCLLSLAKKVKSQVAVSGSSARVFLSVRMWGDGSGAGAPPVELCKAADCMVGAWWIHSNLITVFSPLLLFKQPSTSTTWPCSRCACVSFTASDASPWSPTALRSTHHMQKKKNKFQNLQWQGSQFRPKFCRLQLVLDRSDVIMWSSWCLEALEAFVTWTECLNHQAADC